MIYQHPDGSYHRHPPYRTEAKQLEPIKDRPGWWRDPRTGEEKYIEPPQSPNP